MKGPGGEAPPRTTSSKVPGVKRSGWELRPPRPLGSSGIHYCHQRHAVPRLTGLEKWSGGEQSVPSVAADDVGGRLWPGLYLWHVH